MRHDSVCAYNTLSAASVWEGQQGFDSTDVLVLCADLRCAAAGGSLQAWKNGAFLGVLTRGLTGAFCWSVDLLESGSSVRISGLSPKEQASALKVQEEAEVLRALCDRIRSTVVSWSTRSFREFQMMSLRTIRAQLAKELDIDAESIAMKKRIKNIVVDVVQNLD